MLHISLRTCKHCGDRLGLSLILCDTCAHKAMQVIHSDPKERLQIYKTILEVSDNPITKITAKQLMDMDAALVEEQETDPTDRMFNPRG